MPPEAAVADPSELKLEILYRFHEITDLKEIRAEGSDRATYEIAISSEYAVKRWFGTEILVHEKGAVDMTYAKRGLSLIDNHYGDQIGVVENIRLDDDKVLRGVARFSRSVKGQEFEQDVKDKTRRFVSVGYRALKAIRLEKGENPGDDKWSVTRWMPYEASIVPIPADPTVGPNRGVNRDAETFPVEIEGVQPKEERKMEPTTQPTVAAPAATPVATVEVGATRSAGGPAALPETQTRDQQVQQIMKVCQANGVDMDRASDWVGRGLTLDQVAGEILKVRGNTPATSTPAAEHIDNMTAKERGAYSYTRALRIAAGLDGRNADGAEGVAERADGLEWQTHLELKKRAGMSYASRGGILVPMRVHPEGQRSTRAMGTGVAGGGAEIVFDQPGELIDILRNKTALIKRGATVLSGLKAPIAFPEQTTDATIFWVGENPSAAVTASQLNFGIKYLTPKTMQGTVPIPRQLLTIASFDVEAKVRNSLGAGHGLKLDLAGLHGPGTDFAPQGIYNTPGVQTFAMGGVPDYAKLVDMTAKLPDKNADLGNMGWIMSPLMAGRLKRTPVISGAAAGFIWNGNYFDGEVAGFGASATKQISETLGAGAEQGMIFGNFNDVVVGMFGVGMELIVDPYTLADKGQIKVTSFQMADIVLLRGVSVVCATGATLV